MTFKPLLAHTIEDTSKINYPVMVSVKLDGIRCIVIDGVAYSRSLKPIRNTYVQACIGKPEYNGLDGELIVGDPFAKDCYLKTNSGVMSADGEPDFKFYIFDRIDMESLPFAERLNSLPYQFYHTMIVGHVKVYDEAGLLEIEEEMLSNGAEGIMVRSLDGKYKQGRSTMKEGILGKVKRFQDAEYKIIGFEERMFNGNEATINALGYTERSSHQENKVGKGDLGALVLELSEGVSFNCGTGFDDAQRKEIWDHKEKYLGQYAMIKSFAIGVKDLPRFPVFKGIRSKEDMS